MKRKKSKIIMAVVLLLITGVSIYTFAASIPVVTLTPQPSENNMLIEWTIDDTANYEFKAYKLDNESGRYQPISSVDIETGSTKTQVLNVYPATGPTITFNTYDGEYCSLPKAASLKRWIEEPNAESAKGYGKGLIEVTPVTLADYNANPNGILKDASGNFKYDVIMFGTWDGNGFQNTAGDLVTSSLNATKEFLDAGRGVLFGHDTLINWPYGGDVKPVFCQLAPYLDAQVVDSTPSQWYNGVYETDGWAGTSDSVGHSRVKLMKDGVMTKYPWDIGEIGTILQVPACHSLAQIPNGDIWLKFTHPNYTQAQYDSNWNFYLTTNNNAAMIQTGHSNCEATADEQKIIANTLFYLHQMTNETYVIDNNARDYAKPAEVSASNINIVGKNVTIDVSRVDNGTQYSYYAEAIKKDGSDRKTSEVTSATITTEVKGYSYVVDENATTNIDETIDTTESRIEYTLGNGPNTYLHIRAIDNAGNVGPVSHILIHTNQAPELELSQNPTEWTNGNVVITATGTDSDGEVVSIRKPNGTVDNLATTTHEVETNGTYEFIATDNSGATTTETIEITNIDKVKPEATTSVTQPTASQRSAKITINVTDDASGVAKIVKPDGSEVTTSETEYFVTESGTYTFKFYDVAGNENTKDVQVTIVSDGLEVKYIDKVTGDEIATKETKSGNIGDPYNTSSKEIAGYELVTTPSNKSGVLTIDKITVIYEYKKNSNVVTKYVDENTGNEIPGVNAITVKYKEGDTYTTEKKTIDGYTYTRDTENTSGTVGRENIEVIYYYKKNSGVTVKYIDKYETDLEVADSVSITGLEGENYTTTKKDVSGYVYDSVVGDVNGNIGPTAKIVTYYYIKESNVVAKYVDENTGAEIPGVDRVTTTYKEKDTYTTEKKTIEGYTYTRDTENTSGTVGRDNIEVIYYYKKNSGVTVKYIDKYETDLEVADSVSITGLEGDAYTTTKKDVSGYVYDSVDGEVSGNIGATATTVTYYYIKQSNVVTKYIDENTGAEIPGVDRVTTTYKEKDAYTTEKKTIDGYTYTRDTENTSGTVGRTNIDVIYYYKKNSGVTVRYIDKYETDLEVADSVSITGLEGAEYTTTPKDVSGYAYDSVVGEANGRLQATATTVTYYYIKQSNVVTKYIDENTGAEIPGVDRVTTTYKEKDAYTTEKKTIDGYTYTRDTENTNGTVGRENIEVIYYYKKNSGVTVKYIDKYQTDLEVVDAESITGLEGDNYKTIQKDVPGYAYDSVNGEVSGKLQATVTTITYYYVKESNVTTKYVDELTGEEIHDEKVVKYKQNDVYSTSSEEIAGYTLVKTPDNKNGIVQREDITVTYEYRKVSQGVEIQYIDQANGNKISSSIIKNGVEGTEYTSEAKDIPGYELVKTPENANGEMTVEKIVVKYEYRLISYVTVNYEDEVTRMPLKAPISTKYLEGQNYTSTQESFDGYTFSRVEGTPNGTMGRENIVITYYYKKNTNVIVKYVDMLDGNREIADAKTIAGVEGQAYTTEPLEIPEYEYIRCVGKTSGNMTTEPITVMYKYKKLSTLTTTHIDIDSGEEIYDPVVTTYKEGDTYEALPQNIAGYVKIEEPAEKTGVIGRENITRTYKYRKISEGLVVKYVDVKTNDVLDEVVYDGNVGDVITLDRKSFMYYLLYSKPDFDTVTLTDEHQEVIYYYVRSIKMDVIGVDEETGKELFRTKIEGPEGDPYDEEDKKDLDGYELVEMPANAKGFFNRRDAEIKFVYRKLEQKVETSVVAKYIDRDTEKELDSATIIGYVGDPYRTDRKEFAGYELVKIEGNEYGKMEGEQKVVKYIYARKSGKVIVTYEDEKGNLIDSEELTGKVGEDYEVKVKEIDGYEVVEIPDNVKGKYTEDIIEVKVKVQKIHVAPAEKGTIIVKFVDSQGSAIKEKIVQTGDVGEKFYFEAPQIDGYKIVLNSNIKAEYTNEEQVFDVIYEKISVEKPEEPKEEEKDVETGDINVLVLTVMLSLSIIGIKKQFSVK